MVSAVCLVAMATVRQGRLSAADMNIASITTAVGPDTSTAGDLSERWEGGSQGFVIVSSPSHPVLSS